jgi:hypothetical protein
MDGKEDFMFEAGNINIEQLAQTVDMDFEGSGLIDLNLD